jgi:hypothetical protein
MLTEHATNYPAARKALGILRSCACNTQEWARFVEIVGMQSVWAVLHLDQTSKGR